jgi:hypothetical protein
MQQALWRNVMQLQWNSCVQAGAALLLSRQPNALASRTAPLRWIQLQLHCSTEQPSLPPPYNFLPSYWFACSACIQQMLKLHPRWRLHLYQLLNLVPPALQLLPARLALLCRAQPALHLLGGI